MGGEGKDEEISNLQAQWMLQEIQVCVEGHCVNNLMSNQITQRANINKVSRDIHELVTALINQCHGSARKYQEGES